ncbi:unnamed protein product [Vicia faba]|uniref:RNase H type-1 domain-containing protein n=1 Tax=Vicia faba TaxID=3906 RepID=A0AAV1B788_VICFA|nr:unnamed protein product [Vicia faba]
MEESRVKRKKLFVNEGLHPKDTFLVFVDVSCFDGGFLVLGCVIKDMYNRVVISTSKEIDSSASPLVDGALALRWSIQSAINLSLPKVAVHFDALAIVDCVNGVRKITDVVPFVMDCQN